MEASTSTASPLFIDSSHGQLFCVERFYEACSEARRQVLFVPPFGDEMNKSRKMFNDTARSLACENIPSVILDLYGTGDSEGEFVEATWEVWVDSVAAAVSAMKAKCSAPITVVGLRLGCLVALNYLVSIPKDNTPVDQLILWQPVLNGELFIKQFFRTRVAAEAFSGNDKITVDQLLSLASESGAVEVAGYELSHQLIEGIRSVHSVVSDCPFPQNVSCEWFEVSRTKQDVLPASKRFISKLQDDGVGVSSTIVKGDSFWSAQEICVVPALASETVNAVCRGI